VRPLLLAVLRSERDVFCRARRDLRGALVPTRDPTSARAFSGPAPNRFPGRGRPDVLHAHLTEGLRPDRNGKSTNCSSESQRRLRPTPVPTGGDGRPDRPAPRLAQPVSEGKLWRPCFGWNAALATANRWRSSAPEE